MAYKHVKLKRMRAKYNVDTFIEVCYDKLVNRVNGYGKARYSGMELLSRDDFRTWAKSQGQLYALYHDWNKEGHTRKFMPTVDRIDSSQGYILGNIRWLTQSENSRLGRMSTVVT